MAVVCIGSAQHLARCLEALRAQRGAPDFDVVVACDPEIPGVDAAGKSFPGARIIANPGQRTIYELASCALRESAGELILLTEDHCAPSPDWVRAMVEAQRPGRAAVGGRVERAPGATPTDWGYYFADYFRYAAPVAEGPAPSLTACNVSYKRGELEQIRNIWEARFEEPVVHAALHERFGVLWMQPESVVATHRHVALGAAARERYAFGRLFGCTRIEGCTAARRLAYALLAPGLPVLMLARMAGAASRSASSRRSFLRSLGPIALLALSWSWGEWLGYVTGSRPRTLTVAPEVRGPLGAADGA